MATQIQLGDMAVDVVLEDIKNVHLSVHPPTGRVTIAVPAHMSLDTIRVFAITKLTWIRQQQRKLRQQEREAPREYLIVHELVHILEPTHNARFIALMDHHMPKWRPHQQTLNRLPVRHESWVY